MPQKKPLAIGRLDSTLKNAVFGLICLLPFSPFLVTLISKYAGQHLVIDSWKEILLFSIYVGLVIARPKQLIELIRNNRLVQVIFIYVAFLSLVYLVREKSVTTLAGLVYATRFLLALIVGALSGRLLSVGPIVKKIIGISVVVCVIGFTILALPSQILTHVGYDAPGVDTVNNPASVHYVSESLKIERMMSTFKGPNSLGLYLLLPFALVLFAKRKKSSPYFYVFLIGSSILLTFSRSALLGLLVMIAFYVWIMRRSFQVQAHKLSNPTIAGAIISIIVLTIALGPVSGRLFFHQDAGQSNGSTSSRLNHYQQDATDIAAHPLGNGLGTASPAGRVSGKPVNVSENYYLQIAKESGIIGLLLFIAILVYLYKALKLLKGTTRSVMIASFFGLLVANLFIPAWADEVVAITWWLFAGIILSKQLGVSSSTNTEEML
jgi:hypothetical protein